MTEIPFGDSPFNIAVRINIDKENLSNIKDLIDLFTLYNLQNKIYVYPAKTENLKGGTCESIGGSCIKDTNFLKAEKEILSYLEIQKFKKIATPSYRINYCTADNVHSFTLLPNLKVYKCWHLVSNEKESVGTIVNNEISFNNNIFKWFAYDPFDDQKCKKCKYLPLCMGGCPKIKLMEGKNRCDILKNAIEKYLQKLLATKK